METKAIQVLKQIPVLFLVWQAGRLETYQNRIFGQYLENRKKNGKLQAWAEGIVYTQKKNFKVCSFCTLFSIFVQNSKIASCRCPCASRKSSKWTPETKKYYPTQNPWPSPLELKNVLAYTCCCRRCAYAKLPLPPSWPPLPPCCHRHAAAAYPVVALLPPPTPRSCQAAASIAKLAATANAMLLPSSRHQRQAGRHPRAVTALPPPPPSPLFPSLLPLLSSLLCPCF